MQLHAIQELCKLMPDEVAVTSDVKFFSSDDNRAMLCLFLSKVVVDGVESSKSMRLLGQIQGQYSLIMVDFDSSHTFVSTQLASRLTSVSQLDQPLLVMVANGVPIHYAS
jgi:hypothetical protein